jgi:putative serine protease PepD
MPVEEPDEDEPVGPPPHPLDRVWFHPSEVGAALAAWREGQRPKRREWGLAAIIGLVSVGVVVGVLAGVGAFSGGSSSDSVPAAPPPVPAGSSLADVVNAAAPSVVSVRAVSPTGAAQGSGVAMDGTRVLTSTSLLGAATVITVTSSAGRLNQARVVGADPETDLTLLEVDGGNLAAARLGDSDALQVGDAVIALGLSAGQHRWAGEGIVSALHTVANGPGGVALAGLLETDVRMASTDPALNLVASGGALVDSGGSVVGINSAALPGQAVPISLAHDVVEQLESSGMVHHGWLGVNVVGAIDRPGGGAEITAVAASSPAAAAGLEPGDVVTAVVADGNTSRVTDAGDLVATVEGLRNGDPATVSATRAGAHLTKQVSLGDRPAVGGSIAGLGA